jgi:hypothetical protein
MRYQWVRSAGKVVFVAAVACVAGRAGADWPEPAPEQPAVAAISMTDPVPVRDVLSDRPDPIDSMDLAINEPASAATILCYDRERYGDRAVRITIRRDPVSGELQTDIAFVPGRTSITRLVHATDTPIDAAGATLTVADHPPLLSLLD